MEGAIQAAVVHVKEGDARALRAADGERPHRPVPTPCACKYVNVCERCTCDRRPSERKVKVAENPHPAPAPRTPHPAPRTPLLLRRAVGRLACLVAAGRGRTGAHTLRGGPARSPLLRAWCLRWRRRRRVPTHQGRGPRADGAPRVLLRRRAAPSCDCVGRPRTFSRGSRAPRAGAAGDGPSASRAAEGGNTVPFAGAGAKQGKVRAGAGKGSTRAGTWRASRMDVFESTYRPHRPHGPHRAGARSCGEAAPTGAAQSTQQRSGAPRRAGCGQEQQAGGLGLVDAERQRLPHGAQWWVVAGVRLLRDVSELVCEDAKLPGSAVERVDAFPAETADPCRDCTDGIQPRRQRWGRVVWKQRLRRHFLSGRGR